MSPRRSSRARSSQIPSAAPPQAPSHTSSSTSTGSVSKGERNTRSNHRTASPSHSSVHRSESVDAADEASPTEPMGPRRSRRGNGDEKDIPIKRPEEYDDEQEPEEVEEEVTRCICGRAEYPGPSASLRESYTGPEPLSDDLGNFFVQCDNCQVWEHGGCMGLTDEANLPEEYYCEQCKPEFHKIIRGPNGSRSSHYLPLLKDVATRSSSLSSNVEDPRKRDAKQKPLESTKRRATMNSRGAYDEDELLRRAIEESKEMGSLGKRTRDDSEDHKNAVKRQRTASSSPSAEPKRSQSPSETLDDVHNKGLMNAGNKAIQKSRGSIAAARNTREKEIRDKQKEQAAAQRAEAASKRNARSERRRGEDSPPPTPSLSPSKAAVAQNSNKTKADTPPSGRGALKRKTGRPPARRGRVGGTRTQYTRDSAAGEGSDTPMRDTSQERSGNAGSPSGVNGINGESGRSSKAKTHPARTSLNEMKRRVAAILEFVGRMQSERASQSRHSSGSDSSKGANTPNGVGSNGPSSHLSLPTASLIKAVEAGLKEADASDGELGLKFKEDKDFGIMDSVEMMETLTKELVQWQSVYGIYSR